MTIKFDEKFPEGKYKGRTPAELILMLQNDSDFEGVDYLLWLRKFRAGKFGGLASTFDETVNAIIDLIVFEVPELKKRYPVTVYTKLEAKEIFDKYHKEAQEAAKQEAIRKEMKARADRERAERYKGKWGAGHNVRRTVRARSKRC